MPGVSEEESDPIADKNADQSPKPPGRSIAGDNVPAKASRRRERRSHLSFLHSAQAKKIAGGCRRSVLVEAAGQLVPYLSIRAGLCLHPLRDAGRVIRHSSADPSARSGHPQRVYESLQGRHRVGLVPTPRRCHSQLALGFTDVSPVFTLPLRVKATIDRTRVRKSSAFGSTCLSCHLISPHAARQAGNTYDQSGLDLANRPRTGVIAIL